jgi:hypothetical protein
MPTAIASIQPVTRQIVTGLVVAAPMSTPLFNIPNDLQEMRLVIQVTAASGTTPTLDAALQDSPDQGTTWIYTGNKFAQMIAVDMRQISLSRLRQASQAAAEFSGNVPAIAAAAAAASGPIARQARINFQTGGTTPSFTVNVFLIGSIQA